MEILIRNADPLAVKKIDEIAKKRGMSRNEFLIRLLKRYTLNPEMEIEKRKIEDRYEQLLLKIIPILEENTETMKKMNSVIEEIVNEDPYEKIN
ncbi:hypothetical protein [Heyndrickxia ginsengihumi]|uniref:hypothetical protein n=1 Tax=Heyndrickxia ginsengihumi TaxID=363870 RepID=UPI00046EB6C6|nr:hypothetical protein [Heyndrickxia ginsengihumi]